MVCLLVSEECRQSCRCKEGAASFAVAGDRCVVQPALLAASALLIEPHSVRVTLTMNVSKEGVLYNC